jgi:hypothetical protein
MIGRPTYPTLLVGSLYFLYNNIVKYSLKYSGMMGDEETKNSRY